MTNQSEFLDALPSLLVSPDREISRLHGPPDSPKLVRLDCPRSGRPCVASCAMFGAKRQGASGPFVVICRASGRPMPLGVPDKGFDPDTLISFSKVDA